MSKVRVFKAGDYVEVRGDACAGVEVGEQGLVLDDHDQDSLGLMFLARCDHWASDEMKLGGQFGWLIQASKLKLLYRPRVKEV